MVRTLRLYLIIAGFGGLLSGCFLSYESVELSRAEKHARAKNFEQALKHYDRVIKRSPKSKTAIRSAKTAASLCFLELKDFTRSIRYFRHLILHSGNQQQRYEAQKSIADIYFEKLSDYANSVLEYNKLLKLPHSDEDYYLHKMRIARSHFQLNDFFQSGVEVDSLLNRYKGSRQKVFELSLFKANILLTTKKVEEAIDIYIDLLTNYPEESSKENVPISLAIAYEEQKDFGKAIRVLRDVEAESDSEDFIQLKIKRLEDRARNQPGASGLRR